MDCDHEAWTSKASQHSITVALPKRTRRQLAGAAGKPDLNDSASLIEFPQPLVLPNDDLACDARYPPQSVRTWRFEKERNPVTPERQTIYVAAPPRIASTVAHMATWNQPNVTLENSSETTPPAVNEVVRYLSAFYHDLPVKVLPPSVQPLRFIEWTESKKPGKNLGKTPLRDTQVALATESQAIRIRARPCPDKVFPYQLDLNDLLDVVIEILPQDAYCLLLLVDQDMYEDEDDDFCAGRAFGGSRCAVVSTARYNPLLYSQLSAEDLEHPWPLSHCAAYVMSLGGIDENIPSAKRGKPPGKNSKKASKATANGSGATSDETSRDPSHALEQAFAAFKIGPLATNGSDWLFSVCKTASHEIGHCFGMDHCVYFACIMQGTASIAEDRRQPPDLCPIDLEKMRLAVSEHGEPKVKWEEERCQALLDVCREHTGASWSAFQAWLKVRIEQVRT